MMALTLTPGTFLIILAITIAISLGAGYAVSKFEEHPALAPKDSADPTTQLPVVPEEHTILNVTIDKSLAWHLELDGVRVQVGNLTAEQRTRLVNVLVQIRPWVEGKPAPALASPAPTPAAPRQTGPLPPLATSATRTQPLPGLPPGEAPKIDIGRGFRSLMTSDLKKLDKVAPVSIVALIDDFLQKRLEVSPLTDRQIRLEEGALGEVIVLIGKQRYPGVEAVPDPQVQTIIRAAIADWEKSA